MSTDAAKPRELPRLVVVLVVIATGAATVWAATKMGPLGPYTSWDRAQQAVQQVWTPRGQAPQAQLTPIQPQALEQFSGAAPQQPSVPAPQPTVNQSLAAAPTSDPLFPLADDSAARTVGLPGVPTIIWGTPRPHRDRGPCVNCHTVATGNGQRVPTIFSFSAMPHEYRGVCNNCHQISVAGFGGNLVAGIRTAEPADAQLQMQVQGAANEGEWRGMEVSAASQGVVITKADGAAARAGVQPGDVVDSINGVAVRSMTDFIQVTLNGDLPQGTMIARRNGQRMAFELQRNQPGTANQQAASNVGAAPQAQQQLPMSQQMMAPQQQLMTPQQQMVTPQQQQPMTQQQQQLLAPQQLAPQQLAPQQLAPQQLAPQQLAPQQLAPQQQMAPQQWFAPMLPSAPATPGG
jgi:hypothetical protein